VTGQSYRISPDVAWVDAEDGGRSEHVVWITRLDTAELFELAGAAWLVWSLLTDGFTDAAAIRREIDELEMTVDFGEGGLDGFLSALEAQELIVAEA
jgi:hypothetical protein